MASSKSKRVKGQSTTSHALALALYLGAFVTTLIAFIGSAWYDRDVPISAPFLLRLDEGISPISGDRYWQFDAWRWCRFDAVGGPGICSDRKLFYDVSELSLPGAQVKALNLPYIITHDFPITSALVFLAPLTLLILIILVTYNFLCPSEDAFKFQYKLTSPDFVLHKYPSRGRTAWFLRSWYPAFILFFAGIWTLVCLAPVWAAGNQLPPGLRGSMGVGSILLLAGYAAACLGQLLIWIGGLRVEKSALGSSSGGGSSGSKSRSGRSVRSRPSGHGSSGRR